MHVTIRQLRSETKAIIQAIEHGQTVIVTSHGQAKAKILPIINELSKSAIWDEFFGMWETNEKTRNVPHYIKSLREPRKIC